MKCFYYVSETLDISEKVSDDLHEAGLSDWYLHIITKNSAGLVQKHLHSSNYIETLDLVRATTAGGIIGFAVALVAAALVYFFEPFGTPATGVVYIIGMTVITLFGVWEGGLWGVASENKKLKPFHDDIESGKYLILAYIGKEKEETIVSMMKSKHPDAKLAAIDTHFINPFSKLKLV